MPIYKLSTELSTVKMKRITPVAIELPTSLSLHLPGVGGSAVEIIVKARVIQNCGAGVVHRVFAATGNRN